MIDNRGNAVKNLNVRVAKYNKTSYILKGGFETIAEFTDDYSIILECYAFQGNEFRQNQQPIVKDNLCTLLKKANVIYPQLSKTSNLPPQNGEMCPIKPQKFNIFGYAIEKEALPDSITASPKWRMDFTISHKMVEEIKFSVYIVVYKVSSD